jgi:hypothetical protein
MMGGLRQSRPGENSPGESGPYERLILAEVFAYYGFLGAAAATALFLH